jgi:hypothetical protein
MPEMDDAAAPASMAVSLSALLSEWTVSSTLLMAFSSFVMAVFSPRLSASLTSISIAIVLVRLSAFVSRVL